MLKEQGMVSEALSNAMGNLGGIGTQTRQFCLAMLKQATLDLHNGQRFDWTSAALELGSSKAKVTNEKGSAVSGFDVKILARRRYCVALDEVVQLVDLEINFSKVQVGAIEPFETYDVQAEWGGIGVGYNAFSCQFSCTNGGYPYNMGGFEIVRNFIQALEQSGPND